MVDFAKRVEESKARHNIANRPATNVSITVAGNDYAVKFGFDRALLDRFQAAVPDYERTWYPEQKVWLVTPVAILQAKAALESYISGTIDVPPISPGPVEVLEKTFTLEYLGQTKDRGGKRSAFGCVKGKWSAEFPEEILTGFFEGQEVKQIPLAGQTLYQALCIFEKAEPEEIKKAYKRLARQWHPDVCKEENAAEMFRKINGAYEVLMGSEKRNRYDAGLYFERQGQDKGWATKITSRPRVDTYGYRAPLRCGLITARGTVRLMRFVVQEILAWEDVINEQGQVMVSSWPLGAKSFQTLWV